MGAHRAGNRNAVTPKRCGLESWTPSKKTWGKREVEKSWIRPTLVWRCAMRGHATDHALAQPAPATQIRILPGGGLLEEPHCPSYAWGRRRLSCAQVVPMRPHRMAATPHRRHSCGGAPSSTCRDRAHGGNGPRKARRRLARGPRAAFFHRKGTHRHA